MDGPTAHDDPVWPHLSLAYAHATVPAAPLLDALATVPVRPVPAQFEQVSLIELYRAERTYRWRCIADAPLHHRATTGRT